jgi:type IV secretory pathway component VirB8
VTIEKTTAAIVIVAVVAEMAMATVAVAAVVAVVPSQTTDAVTANRRVTGKISASDEWKTRGKTTRRKAHLVQISQWRIFETWVLARLDGFLWRCRVQGDLRT